MDDYLRFEILKYLVCNGRSSKIMVEKAFGQHKHITKTNRSVKHHRPDILDGFEFLRTEGSIVKLNTDPGKGKVYGRGRPQKYYAITEYGLKKLIADKRISKTQFWQVISHYCSNTDSVLTIDKIEGLLLTFMNHYVKYRYHGFTLYSDDFLKVCNNLFKERIQISDRISTFQKVLEVLAINPKIAFNDLVEKVGEPKSRVKKVLSLYSYRPRSFQGTDTIKNDYGKKNADFIVKNIITMNQESNDGSTYDLSLFGVMLTLIIILHNAVRQLKQGLYLEEYTLEEYCDKIAYNYSDKLPLIFGKWGHLRRILRGFAVSNLDVVLLDGALVNNESNSLSVTMKGNNEIFRGIRTVLQYNNSLMRDLVNAGLEVLLSYFSVRSDLDAPEQLEDNKVFEKVNPVWVLLEEIMILLNPLWYRYPRLSFITFTALDPNRILKYIEESLSDEISAFYYMNLLKPHIDIDEMKIRHDSMLTRGSSKDIRGNLEKRLSLFVQEVKGDPTMDWVRKLSEDLSSMYQEIGETIKTWSLSPIFR
ncbi:MAG: hypothetical protein WBL67_04215 [Nitrososphaeraceae archaeon]